MAARSVRAFLHNQTPDTLFKIRDEIDHGEWAGWRPPNAIAPFMTVPMGSESDGFLTGTEANVTYQIGNDQAKTLYAQWDNPFAGSNSYHTNTDITHDSFWTAIDGNNSVVNYELRVSRRVATDFLPSRDGFQFDNSWPDTPYSLPPLRGSFLDLKYGNAHSGLCGGFVFGSLDYFYAGQQIPQQRVPPFGEQDPLFLYLVDRLFDTFTVGSVLMMLNLMDPAFPDTDEGVLSVLGLAEGRAAIMAHKEWPAIREDIDQGRPSPLFIQTIKSLLPTDLGHNHQILAYAYEAQGHDIIIWVYDPNQPRNDEVTMRFNDGDVSQRIVVEHNVHVFEDDGVTPRPIYCFARMDYTAKAPRVLTQPRITGADVASRGITFTRGNIQVLQHDVTSRGRAMFVVIPDCGEHEFEYEIASELEKITLLVTTHGYIAPVIAWAINGHEILRGENQAMIITNADTVEDYSPVSSLDPDWVAQVPGPVTLLTSLHGLSVDIMNTVADGNYSVNVQVTCAEFGEAVSARQEASMAFLGQRETVFGLKEAINQCIAAYFAHLPTEAPSEQAIIDSVYAQLGRPLDPIWDPDPSLIMIDPALALQDPNWSAVEQMQAPDAAAGTGIVDGLTLGTIDTTVGTDVTEATEGEETG